jgi:hypothetical protein
MIAHPMNDDIVERLAEERPFGGALELAGLERLPGWKGGRATAFFVRTKDGRPWKLRACTSPARARRAARWIRRVPDVFPRLEARDGRYLLLERLAGHHALAESALPGHCRALGRMYGRVHARGRALRPSDWLARRFEPRRARRRFERELALLRRREAIDEGLALRIAERFREGLQRHGLPACLELRDLHAGNVMVDERADLRFVDEEGIGVAVKGLGHAKLLAHTTDPSCDEDFRAGYAEVADAAFLAPEHTRFLRLIDSVHSVASKLGRRAEPFKLERSLSALRRAIEA